MCDILYCEKCGKEVTISPNSLHAKGREKNDVRLLGLDNCRINNHNISAQTLEKEIDVKYTDIISLHLLSYMS
jgi:hypothetical protein